MHTFSILRVESWNVLEKLRAYRNYEIDSRHYLVQYKNHLEAMCLEVMNLREYICEVKKMHHLMRTLSSQWQDIAFEILDKLPPLASTI